MNIEQLNKGQALSDEIGVIKEMIKRWESSESFGEETVYTTTEKKNRQSVSLDYVDFAIVKTLTLSTLQKRLTELQKQFDEL